jgi:hypothetical protein
LLLFFVKTGPYYLEYSLEADLELTTPLSLSCVARITDGNHDTHLSFQTFDHCTGFTQETVLVLRKYTLKKNDTYTFHIYTYIPTGTFWRCLQALSHTYMRERENTFDTKR